MYTPAADILGSLALTAAAGTVPLVLFFVLLGVFKLPTHWCAAGAALCAAGVAAWYGMPPGMILASAGYGVAFAVSPILVIVIAAVWLYQLTVTSGRGDDVRAVFAGLGKGDLRIQALIIGYSFCGLLEGLAGFGAPVAIVAAMLCSIGLPPIKAALVTMIGNAIFVGFGAMGIPTITTARLGGVEADAVAGAATMMTPIIAIAVPFVLLFVLDGKRGVTQLWHVALVQGVATAIGQVVAARFISVELISVVAALLAFGTLALYLRVVSVATPGEMSTEVGGVPSTSRIVLGLMPYWLVVVIFAVVKLWRFGVDIPVVLSATDLSFEWPGLYGKLMTSSGDVSTGALYSLQTLGNPATMIVLTAIITTLVYAKAGDMTVWDGVRTLGRTVREMSMACVTICLVMVLAYIMNFSGQTSAIGVALASTGAFFAVLSPGLGWLGTAVTGSATASGALFAGLQSTAALGTGADPTVFLGGNAVGGGIGKIISPQNLAIASSAISKPGSESELLAKATPWSVGLLVLLAIQVVLFSAL